MENSAPGPGKTGSILCFSMGINNATVAQCAVGDSTPGLPFRVAGPQGKRLPMLEPEHLARRRRRVPAPTLGTVPPTALAHHSNADKQGPAPQSGHSLFSNFHHARINFHLVLPPSLSLSAPPSPSPSLSLSHFPSPTSCSSAAVGRGTPAALSRASPGPRHPGGAGPGGPRARNLWRPPWRKSAGQKCPKCQGARSEIVGRLWL